MTIIRFILLALLISCGPGQEDPKEPVREDINPVFKPYYDLFEKISGLRPFTPIDFGTITLKSDEEDTKIVGECWVRFYSRWIIIDREWWVDAGKYKRENLVMHELGHCALDRDHIEDMVRTTTGEDIPKSIMYPSVINPDIYKSYRDYYLDELFHGE